MTKTSNVYTVANPLGNRATRRAQAAFDRKDPRAEKPGTKVVERVIKGEIKKFTRNVKAIQTKGAFGKRKLSTPPALVREIE